MSLIGWHSPFVHDPWRDGEMKYRLREDYEMILYRCPFDGSIQAGKIKLVKLPWVHAWELRISSGYLWNGCSGPVFDTDDTMRASLAHDGLYELMGLGLLSLKHRGWSDEVFRQVCVQDGMSEAKARACYVGLRLFGASRARRSNG